MNLDQFRLLIFEVLEHHLDQINECENEIDVSYHVERCGWAVNYLKRFTSHVPVENREQLIP